MNCKFCNAELEEGTLICPQCGKELTQETTQETEALCPCCGDNEEAEAPEMNEEAAEAALEEEAAEAPETNPEAAETAEDTVEAEEAEQEAPKKHIGRIVVTAICGVLLLGILTVAILLGSGVELGPRGEGILYKSSYTVKDSTAEKNADKVVARVNGKELTNAELQAHYFGNMYQFMDSYGYSYFDYSAPLDSQEFTGADMTWQQYFIDTAITNWHRYQILSALAEEEGFVADLSGMDSLRQELEAAAAQYGFENVDGMIHADMGTSCTMEDYMRYISLNHAVNQYVTHLHEVWDPTLEELEGYYADNEQEFIQAGLAKDSGNIVDVRHILIMPKGEQTDGAYSEAQWQEALQEAERILELWKSGEATEESFAALATEYTEDGGSKSGGGLYTGITPYSSYVKNFLNWSVDEARQVGDTGIVETEYGYHIMYFVGGEPLWMTAARDNYPSYKLNKLINDNEERWPLEVIYRNIVVTDTNVTE